MKKNIGGNFSRAAENYDAAAEVQKIAAGKLCDLLLEKNLFCGAGTPRSRKKIKILDLGSGTGFIANNLMQKLPTEIAKNCEFFELDLSREMLSQSTKSSHKIQADFDKIPCKKNSFDLVISSFSLQWSNDLNGLFSKLRELLNPDGIFAFCLPSDESLVELKQASIRSGCHFSFLQLPFVDSLILAVKKSSLNELCVEMEVIKQNFTNGIDAVKFLKKIGASYSKKSAKNHNITKEKLHSFNAFCAEPITNSGCAISWSLISIIAQK